MSKTGHHSNGLFGVWHLASLDAVKTNGEVATGWLGTSPTGLLAYDRSGYMCVQMMRGGRTGQDEGEAAYYAYFGALEIDEEARTTLHHVQGSLLPDEVGLTYRQDFTLSGHRLTLLTAAHLFHGEERRNRIVWQRAKTDVNHIWEEWS